VPGEKTEVVTVPERRRVVAPPAEEKSSPTFYRDKVKKDNRRTGPGFWAGPRVEIEENHVKRVKRNIFGEALH
jgi:hypothetical protein